MPADDRPRPPRGTLRLGRVRGVELLARPSLLVMAAVLVVLFARTFDTRLHDADAPNPYVLSALFVVAMYVSVLVHEIGHVVVARGYGMPVASVTLHLLGGETAIEGESSTPAQEFWTSVIGPLTSFGIGVVCFAASDVASGSPGDVLRALGFVNVLVAIVNLLPGLPLDGGRVFRALVWGATGREATGIRAAGWAGRVVAVASVAFPFVWAWTTTDPVRVADLVVGVLVGWFMWTGAGHALRGADRTARLNHLDARLLAVDDVVAPAEAPVLSADLRGAPLLRAMTLKPSPFYRLVEADGTYVGMLRTTSVDRAYREGGQ